MRFLCAILLSPLMLLSGGMFFSASAIPPSPPPYLVAPALQETALLLEGFGELERATQLAFHPLLESVPDDASRARLLAFRSRLLARQSFFQRADSILAGMPPPPDREERFVRILTRARLHYLTDDYARAYDLISSIDSLSSRLFSDYRAMLKMQILSALGNYDSAVEIGDPVWRTGIPAPLSPAFEATLLEALESERRYQPALRIIRKVRDRYGVDEISVPFISREMQIYLASGDSARSFQLALDIAENHGTRPIALEFAQIARSLLAPDRIGTDTLLTFCSVFLNHGDTDAAGELLNLVQERRITGYDREHIRYLRARLLFLQRQYATAISLLESSFDDPQLAKHSLLLTARTYRRMKQYRQSAEAYVTYGKAYPGSGLAREALYVAANLYERIGLPIETNQVRTYLAAQYPNYYHGRLSSLRLARDSMSAGDYTRGISILKRTLDSSEGNQEDLLYYMALCYERIGDDEQYRNTITRLRSADPNSFYLNPRLAAQFELPELESRGRIQLSGNKSLLELLKAIHARQTEACSEIEDAIGATAVARSDFAENQFYRRGAVFLDAGFVDWGVSELDAAYDELRSDAPALLAMGRMFERHALAWHSVRIFERLRSVMRKNRALVTSGIFDVLLYPIPYPGTVIEQCVSNKLPPHFAFAMIREESRFDARAVSRAGALGLMQIMPETGKEIARELGYPMRSTQVLLNPEINIAFGMNYAGRLLDQCGGNHHMMLCAYNAGMGNAKRWFTDGTRELSIQEQVDTIEYKETRLYVQRIIESSQRYAVFFGKESRL